MTFLPLHIVAGVLALVFGYVALFTKKGATLHRKSGMLFVFAMVMMSLTGALIAYLNTSPISVVAGLLTFYFVTTALLAVRHRAPEFWWIDRVAMVFALTVSVLAFMTGIAIASRSGGEAAGMFTFGTVGLLATVGDLRMMRAGGVQGSRRIGRHLWRMCFAMWVAAASFFWGPQGRIPEVIRIPALFPIPVLAPIVVMLYWLWRIRVRRTFQGIAGIRASRADALATADHASHGAPQGVRP